MAAGDTLAEIEDALGHGFADRSLLSQAITHSSAGGAGAASLERLEFLGDRVLGLALAALLLRDFPGEPPGDLARRHAALASQQALADVGRALGLHRHLKIQPGLARDREAMPTSMIEDACEAVIGAVYLDAGHDAAAAVVERFWAPMMSGAPPRDAKTALQEWVQARGLPLPVYRTAAREGPDHLPVFTVQAMIEGFPAVESRAGTKRAAERAAAQALLDVVDDAGG